MARTKGDYIAYCARFPIDLGQLRHALKVYWFLTRVVHLAHDAASDVTLRMWMDVVREHRGRWREWRSNLCHRGAGGKPYFGPGF